MNFLSTSSREVKNSWYNKYISVKNSAKEVENIYKNSDFLRKNSVWNFSENKNISAHVSPNNKSPNYDYKKSILKTLEHKFFNNVLPPKTPGVKKHNFVYSGNKHKIDFTNPREIGFWKDGKEWIENSIEVNNDMITFKIDLDDIQSPKVEENGKQSCDSSLLYNW